MTDPSPNNQISNGQDQARHDGDPRKKRAGGFFERGLHWPVGLAVVFVCSASVVLYTAILGAGPGSRMIEPDYYERAVDWDSERARLDAAERLGWTIDPGVAPSPDAAGSRVVSVLLLDDENAPITEATVELVCFAHARAHERVTTQLPPIGGGQYQAKIDAMGQGGMWELRVSVQARGEQALVIESFELDAYGGDG